MKKSILIILGIVLFTGLVFAKSWSPIFPLWMSSGSSSSADALILETGDYLLLESGNKLLLE